MFDDRGRRTAVTHFGLDEKPILLPDGYSLVKWAYNERDKITRQDYFGVNAEAVLYKNAYHGWDSEYDERGNEIATTFLERTKSRS